MKITALATSMILTLAPGAVGQTAFGSQQVISSTEDGVRSIFATDLDGDSDADVLSTSYLDDTIAWYENLGGGAFGSQQVITTAANNPRSVYATDLDGDGDADVFSASEWDEKIAWYENLGSGGFGPQQIITTLADGASCVYATDLDGDGDPDVLSASMNDHTIAWYENLGSGVFGAQELIASTELFAKTVYATDLDDDGDADVLSGSHHFDPITWYENLGGGAFGPTQFVVMVDSCEANDAYAADLDGDGDADLLGAFGCPNEANTSLVAWFENLGGGNFGPQTNITTTAFGPSDVHATDLDGDGDMDVLSAAAGNDSIAWYENLSGSAFGPPKVITTMADAASSVYATDLDGDGDSDVLSAAAGNDSIAWYENLDGEVTAYCVQTKPTSVSGCTAMLSVPDNTLATGVWTATDIPRDASFGTGTVIGTYLYTHGVGDGPSAFSASVPFGTLCLSGTARSGPVLLSGAVGGVCNPGPMVLAVGSLTAPPVAVGEDVNVQLWYRDPSPAVAGNANFSNAVFYTVQ